MKRWDCFLVLGIVLAPMTGLRIAKVGPAEVLVLLWCLLNFGGRVKIPKNSFLVKFWIPFLYIICLGAFYGLMFYPNETDVMGIATWIYLMIISFGVYSGLRKRDRGTIEMILDRVVVLSTVWYLFLYLYSEFVSSSFLGAPLWYGGARFSGGGTNPHQIAVLMSAVVFVAFRNVLKRQGIEKIKFAVCMFVCLFVALETQSSTLVMSIAGTSLATMILWIVNNGKTREERLVYSVLIALVLMVVAAFSHDYLLDKAYEWISSDPNGLGRLRVFSSIGVSLAKSPIIGLGPGVHALGGTIEYHNTYLEIIAMSGLVGLAIFVVFTVRMFRLLSVDYTLMLTVLPLYIYGLSGFAMRRLAFWSILMTIIVLAEKSTRFADSTDS